MIHTQANLPQEKHEIIRMDKNIAKRAVDFVKTYGKDSSMILDIMLYNAHQQQKNIFDFGALEPYDFAKKLGRDTKNILKNLDNPYHAQKENVEGLKPHQIFSNEIENALYKMNKLKLSFSEVVKDYTNNEEIIEVNDYELIKGLRKHVSLKRKDKFYYTYTVGEIFKTHNNKFFTQVDLASLPKLRKPQATFLYLTLIDQKDIAGEDEATPYFNYLCRQANINIANHSDRKQKLKKKLNLIKNVTELDFNFEFTNEHGKHNFGIYILFNKSSITDDKKISVHKAFQNALDEELLELFKRRIDNAKKKLSEKEFNSWKYSESDFSSKRELYEKVRIDIYRANPEKIKHLIDQEANRYFNPSIA